MRKVRRTNRAIAIALTSLAGAWAPAVYATPIVTSIRVTTQDQPASDVYVLIPGEMHFARTGAKAWSHGFPMDQPNNLTIVIEYDRTLLPDPIRLDYRVGPNAEGIDIFVPRPTRRTDCNKNDLTALRHPGISPREILRSILLVDHLIAIPKPNQCAPNVATDLRDLRGQLIAALHQADPRFVGIRD
jgi:hypothetical protein